MKKNVQKISVVLLAILLFFSMLLFTACKNNNQTTQPTPPTESNEWYGYKPHLSKELPVLRINTSDGSNAFATKQDCYYIPDGKYWKYIKPKFDYTNATVSVENCDAAYQMQNVDAQVKIRGNTSAIYYKKPLRIKFTEKQSMLGLNENYKAKDWVLLADWKDASMLRTNLGLYLGQLLYKEAGLYASDFRNVEVYLNGQYWGVYLLCEQTEVGKGRVNIQKAENGYTGTDIGYLIEMDDYAEFEPDNRFWMSFYGSAKLLDEEGINIMPWTKNDYTIKSKIYNDKQRKFIAKYLEDIYQICYRAIVENKYFKFKADRTGYVEAPEITDAYTAVSNVVDIDSFVAVCILQEIAMDADIDVSSFFMSVDVSETGDGKLRFEAPWDFDSAFGWSVFDTVSKTDKLYAANSKNPWMVLFYKPDFIKEKVREKWQDLKAHGVQERLLQYIDDCTRLYETAYARNYAKWQNIGDGLKKNLEKLPEDLKKNDNYTDSFEIIIYVAVPDAVLNCKTQADAARYLKNWLNTRLQALNAIWC